MRIVNEQYGRHDGSQVYEVVATLELGRGRRLEPPAPKPEGWEDADVFLWDEQPPRPFVTHQELLAERQTEADIAALVRGVALKPVHGPKQPGRLRRLASRLAGAIQAS